MKKEITVNNKKVNATKNTISMTMDQLINELLVVCNNLKNNEEFIKVFLDNSPDFNGHLLIVPKKHILDINDMDNNTLLHIHEVSKNMQKLLQERLFIKGLTMLHNSGNAQNIKHFHLHLIPRDKTTDEKEEILPPEKKLDFEISQEIKKLKNMPLLKRSQALVEKVFFEKVDKANNSYMIHLLHVSQDFQLIYKNFKYIDEYIR